MEHILIQMISQITEITKEEESAIIDAFPIKKFKKGHYLLKEGQVSRDSYLVITGCIREYQLNDGEEKTISFYTEHQSAVNFDSLINKTPSKQNFICSEETTVAITNDEKEKEFYKNFPRFETFCREGVEKMMGEKHQQIAEFITLKPEQKYLKLLQERPTLLNRVPQHQIASYLGVKPETLSRIRARTVKN